MIITVESVVEDWLKMLEPTVAARTYQEYERCFNRHALPLIGSSTISELSSNDMQSVLLSASHSPSTAKMVYASIRSFWKFVMIRYSITTDITHRLFLPKLETKEGEAMTEQEVKTFLKLVRDNSKYPNAHILLLTTGVRSAELRAFKWKSWRRNQRTIKIEEQLQRVRGELVSVPTKSREGKRELSLPLLAEEALNFQYEDEQAKGFGRPDDYIFTTLDGKPLLHQYVWKDFKAVQKLMGTDYRLHDLRHTTASTLIRAGVPTKVAQKVLGHSSEQITSRIYAHLQRSDYDRAADTLDNAFGGV